MIQLNLLPDVKLEYIKAQKQRRLFVTLSVLVTVAAIAILIVTLTISFLQQQHLNGLSDDIKKKSTELKEQKDINRILTVQNQLDSLTALHASKPAITSTFTYINQVTPVSVSISNFVVDFTEKKITITGGADSLSSVNKYVDTLKLAKYKESDADSQKAFTDVVLKSFDLNTDTDDKSQAAKYTIEMTFEDILFDITKKINLTSDAKTRTGSAQSTDLFKEAPVKTEGAQ
jgi:hypothetical protein